MNVVYIQLGTDWTISDKETYSVTLQGEISQKIAAIPTIIHEKKPEKVMLNQSFALGASYSFSDLASYLTEQTGIPFLNEDVEQPEKEFIWTHTSYGFTPGTKEYAVESLLSVGNGYLGIRGTTPEMDIHEDTYPALYLAGLYNRVTSDVDGQTVVNEDFVNAPNLQKMYLIIDGQRIHPSKQTIHRMKRQINFKNGLFESWMEVHLPNQKQLLVHTKRFASMENVHHYHLQYSFTPLNFSGEVTFVSDNEGAVFNYNVARYRSLANTHLRMVSLDSCGPNVTLCTETTSSKINITQHAELRGSENLLKNLKTSTTDHSITQSICLEAQQETTYTFEKAIAVFTSKETPLIAHTNETLPHFQQALEASTYAWQLLWDRAQIQIDGDLLSQKLLNLHTYHLFASASPNGNKGIDASVTARGLHGEAYRGHIFWDELFILPFYVYHFPETVKELLMYRYRRLEQAKINAREQGFSGAMFPWQSGLDGSEQSQALHLNPLSGEWKEDHSRLQRHVSLAIAYNIWTYWHMTKDASFMKQYGLELLMEIARFWQSQAKFDPKTKRYSISNVMGPDEFHERYPDTTEGGVKNNAYTNIMVAWLFETLEHLRLEFPIEEVSEVCTKIQWTKKEFLEMKKIKQALAISINPMGIIAQFDGYFDLSELNWSHYQSTYDSIYRMDRILNSEGSSADKFQVAKQADTLMIFYLFPPLQVHSLFSQLGYALSDSAVTQNFHYYLARTTHGSTLSRIVHAKIAVTAGDYSLAWSLYQEALRSDYQDIQGGTTAEGIHTGLMAATLTLPITTFAGVDTSSDILALSPNLPSHWRSLKFSLQFRQVQYTFTVMHDEIEITTNENVSVHVQQQHVFIPANQSIRIPLTKEVFV